MHYAMPRTGDFEIESPTCASCGTPSPPDVNKRPGSCIYIYIYIYGVQTYGKTSAAEMSAGLSLTGIHWLPYGVRTSAVLQKLQKYHTICHVLPHVATFPYDGRSWEVRHLRDDPFSLTKFGSRQGMIGGTNTNNINKRKY